MAYRMPGDPAPVKGTGDGTRPPWVSGNIKFSVPPDPWFFVIVVMGLAFALAVVVAAVAGGTNNLHLYH